MIYNNIFTIELLATNQGVVGSIPASRTINGNKIKHLASNR